MAGGHGHIDPSNKRVALLISVLALVLALSEMLGKSAQTQAIVQNVLANNLWNFFQAKTIRQTTVRTAAEELEALLAAQGAVPEPARKQIEAWKTTAERYQSEPDTGEGRKELAERAKQAEKKREAALAAYHHYEVASAAMQIAIVLASAEIITGVVALTWIAGGLGLVGIAFCAIGAFFPMAITIF